MGSRGLSTTSRHAIVKGKRIRDPVIIQRLREQGFTQKEVGSMLGVSLSTVKRAAAEAPPDLPRLPEDPRDPSAVATLRRLLLSDNESVALRAALGLLGNADRVRDAGLIEADEPEEDGGVYIRVPVKP
jgi:hypothetical protein